VLAIDVNFLAVTKFSDTPDTYSTGFDVGDHVLTGSMSDGVCVCVCVCVCMCVCVCVCVCVWLSFELTFAPSSSSLATLSHAHPAPQSAAPASCWTP
jgi:hypothetical protein